MCVCTCVYAFLCMYMHVFVQLYACVYVRVFLSPAAVVFVQSVLANESYRLSSSGERDDFISKLMTEVREVRGLGQTPVLLNNSHLSIDDSSLSAFSVLTDTTFMSPLGKLSSPRVVYPHLVTALVRAGVCLPIRKLLCVYLLLL